MQTTAQLDFDCLWASGSKVTYFTADTRTPAGRADMVREAREAAKDKMDAILLGAGLFDFGGADWGPTKAGIVGGLGKEVTICQGAKQIDPRGSIPFGVQFPIGDSIVQDMSLINEPPTYTRSDGVLYQEDGGCTGFDDGPHAGGLRNCIVRSNDWTIYNWSAFDEMLIENCDIYSGRICVACEDSGEGQTFLIRNSRLYGDATLSKSVGATSNASFGGVYGVIFRGGLLRMTGCEIDLKGAVLPGPSFTPWTCGVTDFFADVPSDNTLIELRNCYSSVSGGDPMKCFDLRITQPTTKVRVIGGGGSAWDGSFSRTSAAPVAQPGA